MNLSKGELLVKLEAISILHKKALAIKSKMNNYAPEDNYERTVKVPKFPGNFDEDEREELENAVDHTDEDAVEQISEAYDELFLPIKPSEPKKPNFSTPYTGDIENRGNVVGCFSYIAIATAVFFVLGAFISVEKDDPVRPTLFIIAAVAAALFVLFRIIVALTKGAEARKLSRARAEYDREISKIDAQYSQALKSYENKCEAIKNERAKFLKAYKEWRGIYLKREREEEVIRQKLDIERREAVAKIEKEEFEPVFQDFAALNDLVTAEYLPALDTLIQLIQSGRADDLKEAINLYEDMVYRERQLQLQREKEEQRQREEERRRQDEERRYCEEKEQRRMEEYLRERDEEKRRIERERQEYAEQQRQQRERSTREAEANAQRMRDRHNMYLQCDSCAYRFNGCHLVYKRVNCPSYHPKKP